MFCAEHFILELILHLVFMPLRASSADLIFNQFYILRKLVISSIGFFTNAMITLFCDT